MEIKIGDILLLKKNHPCGGDRFSVLSVGSDILVKCLFCGRVMPVPRVKLEKSVKEVKRQG